MYSSSVFHSLLCISITINVYISVSMAFLHGLSIFLLSQCNFLLPRFLSLARSRHLCVRDFLLDFNVIEIKQLKHGKKPHWHVYSLLHHDRFTYTRNCVHGRREQKEQKKIVTMLMEKMMKIGRGEPKLRENKLSVT